MCFSGYGTRSCGVDMFAYRGRYDWVRSVAIFGLIQRKCGRVGILVSPLAAASWTNAPVTMLVATLSLKLNSEVLHTLETSCNSGETQYIKEIMNYGNNF